MRAIEIGTYGPPEVLRMVERSVPQPQLGEVLIRVLASGVNRPDVLQRLGRYPPPPGISDVPGLEVAGCIEAGDEVMLAQKGLRLGDSVCALVAGGGYAQYCVAPVAQCLPVPQGLTLVQAASLPETFFTVWSNVWGAAHLQPGERFLVHGGSSGIGVAAIQLAKAMGAGQVLATAGTAEKCEACRQLGADVAINYRTEDFVDVVQTVSHGHGMDVILDMVAGTYLPRNMAALAVDGRLAIIATLGGRAGELDCGVMLRRRLTVMGTTLRSRPVAFKAKIAEALHQQVWPLLSQGMVRPVVHTHMPAECAAQAHALMESGQHIGKIVLTWNEMIV